MNTKVYKAACPYCLTEKRQAISPETAAQVERAGRSDFAALLYCDEEEGGCGQPFAVTVNVALAFAVEIHALAGREVQAGAEDRRRWTVKTRNADDPEADSTDYLDAARLRERARGNAIFTLALEMEDGDKLSVVFAGRLVSFDISCEEDERPASPLGSIKRARRVARDAAARTGVAQIIFWTGTGFEVIGETAAGVAAPEWEEVQTVAPPVVFKITVGRRAPEPENNFEASVTCDDERANPELQQHGNSELYSTPASVYLGFEEAARDAAAWIRAEFGDSLDIFIDAPCDVEEDDDIPL